MENQIFNDIIVDTQYGDCGKGKIVKYLADLNNYQYCVKPIGGANAGHTIYHNGIKHIGHQVPSVMVKNAYLQKGENPIICVIGPNCYVDLEKLDKELTSLENLTKSNLRKYMKIAYNAHVTLPKHIEDDKANDMSGSTHCGIRPTARDKYDRCGKRVIDFADKNGKVYGCDIVNTFELLNDLENPTRGVLFEGSQGFWLDINWGKYPFITSSDCTSASVSSCGMPLSRISRIWGVAKIYETYVGANSFQPEDDEDLKRIQIVGEEFGATTGRPRQCNWLNLDKLRQAIIMNDVTHLAFNKCDIIEEIGVFKLYHNQNLIQFSNLLEMKDYINQIIKKFKENIEIIYSYSKETL